MTIAILGCGYVGQAIAQHWQQQGHSVTVTTTTPARRPELEAIAAQVKLVQGHDLDAVTDLIAGQTTLLISVGAPRRDAYAETYLQTANTLGQAIENLGDRAPGHIIYTSSYAVYGDQQGAWVTESTPVQPANEHGEILAATEKILLNLATPSRPICILRLGGICGPNREVVKIFRRAAGKTRPGSGEDFSNWIHLDDIVGAIAFAQQHRLHGIYNLVHDHPLPQRELLDRTFTKQNLPLVSWDPTQSSLRPYNARVSNQKLKQAGYQFHFTDIPL